MLPRLTTMSRPVSSVVSLVSRQLLSISIKVAWLIRGSPDKVYGNLRLAHQFGHLLGSELLASGRFADVDCLIPVPLHRRRKWQRGYNQSELLCKAMAGVLHKPVVTGNLIRRRYTTSQTRKNRQDRMDNMSEIFACPSSGIVSTVTSFWSMTLSLPGPPRNCYLCSARHPRPEHPNVCRPRCLL